VNENTKLTKVSFLDTGIITSATDAGFKSDSLLVWRDFDLALYPARTIKCVLEKPNRPGEFIDNICLETKFYFKDTLANRSFKCELVEPVKDAGWEDTPSDLHTWIVRLSQVGQKGQNVNELVEAYNSHELMVLENKAVDKNKFRSIDIRVETGAVAVVNQRVKTGQKEVPESHSFSGNANGGGGQVLTTDSESTAKGASELHYIASSVANSFSERLEVVESAGGPGEVRVGQSLPVAPRTDVEKMVEETRKNGDGHVPVIDANNNCKLGFGSFNLYIARFFIKL